MKERASGGRWMGVGERLQRRLLSSSTMQKVILHGAYFTAGLICARGVVFGRHAPFGVAVVSGCPRGVLWTTALGSAVGYLIPGVVQPSGRYMAALFLLVILRWTLGELVRLRDKLFFGPVITFVPLLTTGVAMAIVDGSSVQTWILYIAEGVIGAGTSYFFNRTSHVIGEGKAPGTWGQDDLTCVILSVGVAVLSLSNLEIGTLSIGRIAAVLMILFSCRYGGVIGGSLSGIVAGAMFCLATSGINGVSGALAFAGLIAGLFAPLGRVATAIAFVVANGVGSLQVGSYSTVMNGIYEVMAASLIFVVWPHKTGSKLSAVFRQPVCLAQGNGLRRSVVRRLNTTAEALETVSESVEAVSERLSQVDTVTIEEVYHKTEEAVCLLCSHHEDCWKNSAKGPMNSQEQLTQALHIEGVLQTEALPEPLRLLCPTPEKLTETISSYYREYIAKESAERKLRQVRDVVTDQFSTTGKLLQDMATELKLYERFDSGMERKINGVLHDRAITPLDVSCKLNKEGRMTIEVETLVMDRYKLSKSSLLRGISRVTGRTFSYPRISVSGERCHFRMAEQPVYKAVYGIAQHTCRNASLCGDSCVCFEDGSRQVAILSDGMGTGGRAAVDGAMASGIMANLIQAGVGYDCALQITNAALMVKSGAETLSTLDVAVVDLFTGEVQLMKAGAPISYVRKGKEVHRLDAISLPIGILDEAVFCKTSARLGDGDLLILFSDGAVAAGEDWVAQLIRRWEGTEPSQLANLIVDQAVKCRTDGRDDDVTSLVIRLQPRPMQEE